MKPAPFAYHAPEDVDGVLSLLAEHGEEAKILAGGQSLVPLLALRLARFDALVDVNRVVGLSGIEERDGRLVIGAARARPRSSRTRSSVATRRCLAEATRLVGHFQIRNRGTIGGSLAHADPAAEYPAVALTLDAELEIAGSGGRRTVAAADLIESAYVTAVEPDEVITSVSFPIAGPRSGHAIEEIARRHGDFALAGVCVAVALDEAATIGHARLTVFGLAERATRLIAVEERLVGAPASGADVADAVAEAVAALDPPSDVQATAEYRKTVAGPLVHRALERALARAAERQN